jgi:hypothetical protein
MFRLCGFHCSPHRMRDFRKLVKGNFELRLPANKPQNIMREIQQQTTHIRMEEGKDKAKSEACISLLMTTSHSQAK